VPLVIPVLRSERENDKFAAAQVLGECGPAARKAVPDLLPMLEGTQYERNRAAAAKALGQIFKDATASEEVDKVVNALVAKLGDKYSDVRRESVYACGMIGPPAKAFLPKVAPLLQEWHPGHAVYEGYPVRCAAAWAVGRMGKEAAGQMDLLITMLHSDGHVNPNLAWAIGQVGPVQENVVPNLMDKIESAGRAGDYPELKIEAYNALARFGAKSAQAVALTRRLLRDTTYPPTPPMRTAMVKMLAAVGPAAKDAAPEIEAQIRLGKSKPGEAEYAALGEEAAKAYKAVTGGDPKPPATSGAK
jgi:HEAT repeat protein